ncbi:hypothetical protein EON64_04485 [archaeon]|nr:MAG: hypothetical protein EON64_04485 [archaeon]
MQTFLLHYKALVRQADVGIGIDVIVAILYEMIWVIKRVFGKKPRFSMELLFQSDNARHIGYSVEKKQCKRIYTLQVQVQDA